MPATLNKNMEVVTLPDFSSLEDTSAFVLYLKENIDRYGVKKLLYHTEMIEHHLQRINTHIACAQNILIRVNGDITPAQKHFYTVRVAKTTARKFYSALNDVSLERALEVEGVEYSVYTKRDKRIELLVNAHVERNVKPYQVEE